jgi:hypothetical protein
MGKNGHDSKIPVPPSPNTTEIRTGGAVGWELAVLVAVALMVLKMLGAW